MDGLLDFGMPLAVYNGDSAIAPSSILEQGEAMRTRIGGSRTLYAAIEARYANGAAERFVIAYTCERSLRELFAARSIVASGCSTREDAEEECRGETRGRERCQQQMCYVFG
jgi:hypothetical protein